MRAYVNEGKPLVAKRRDGIAQERDAEEDEVELVGLRREDAFASVVGEDVDAANEEQGGTEVDGERNGNGTDGVKPATNPTGNATPRGWGQHERLVVDTCGRRRSFRVS